MAIQILETREVQVQQVNGHGFKATDGAWLNFSKFAKPDDVAMPRVGERVVVHLDKAGFVRKVEPATAAPAIVAVPSIAFPSASESPPASLAGQPIVQDDRGVVVTRLAVLNTATAILSSGGGAATLDEVLTLAERLEAWATR